MYLITELEHECCGCFACRNACPVDAIRTVQGDDKFLYPKIDKNKCIDCGKCKQVCPKHRESHFYYPSDCFAGITKDAEEFKKSSSGGAFKAIVNAVKDFCRNDYKNFYVAGVTWDENFKAVYDVVKYTSSPSIDRFCKSKYVQCEPFDVYKEVSELLKADENFVIFSGCPCHVAALYAFVGKKENLFTVDILCKGPPSQDAFDTYKCELENKWSGRLTDYKFRNKEILDNGTLYIRSACYSFDNGVTVKATRLDDPYLKAFYMNGYLMREGCIQCSFAQPKRVGDVTVGDAWGINKLYPELDAIRGISLILCNSERSAKLRKYLEKVMDLYDCDYLAMIQNNGGAIRTA